MKKLLIIVFLIILAIIGGVFFAGLSEGRVASACVQLGGNVEEHSVEYVSVKLCHFSDGSFCAFELIENGTCVVGKYPYPGTTNDALYPEEIDL